MLKQSPESTITDLQETLGRLQSALAASTIGIWECDIDPERDIREGKARNSQTLLEMLGYGPDEKADTIDWFVSRYHPDDVEMVLAAAERLLSDGTPFDVEFRIKTKSGAYGWFRSRGAYAEWDESAKIFRVCGTLTDITEKKKAEDALRESEKHFRNLMDQSPLPISIFTPDGRFRQVNAAWMEGWGLDEVETAQVMAEYNILTDPQLEELGVMSLVKKAFTGERVVLAPIEYSGQRAVKTMGLDDADARTVWIQIHFHSVKNEQGAVEYVVSINLDITEQKHAEQRLMESEDRFRGLMEQSPLAIELLAPDGRIEQVNAARKQLLAVSEEEVAEILSKYNMLTDPQVVKRGIMPLVKRAFAGERIVLPPIQYDGARAAQDPGPSVSKGSAPWIQCYLYPVKDKRGDLSFVVNTYMDITELRRVEQEAQEQREAMARVSRATKMGQLTGSIAHELNQPLTGILSTAQAGEMMIQNNQVNRDELADVLADIVSDAKRAGGVIHSLREMYRDHKAELLSVGLNGLIEETVQMLHSEFIVRQVRVTTEPASALPRAMGNRAQLQQVLVNLIMNGNEAMKSVEPSRRRLTISSQGGEREIRVWVEDCGPGIDPGQIERIFEPLATWKPGGTGMGLAISNNIIEAHHGSMWAENVPSGGARVGFVVPVLKEDHPR